MRPTDAEEGEIKLLQAAITTNTRLDSYRIIEDGGGRRENVKDGRARNAASGAVVPMYLYVWSCRSEAPTGWYW